MLASVRSASMVMWLLSHEATGVTGEYVLVTEGIGYLWSGSSGVSWRIRDLG